MGGVGLGCVGLSWAVLCCDGIGLDVMLWAGMCCAVLGWAVLVWAGWAGQNVSDVQNGAAGLAELDVFWDGQAVQNGLAVLAGFC